MLSCQEIPGDSQTGEWFERRTRWQCETMSLHHMICEPKSSACLSPAKLATHMTDSLHSGVSLVLCYINLTHMPSATLTDHETFYVELLSKTNVFLKQSVIVRFHCFAALKKRAETSRYWSPGNLWIHTGSCKEIETSGTKRSQTKNRIMSEACFIY